MNTPSASLRAPSSRRFRRASLVLLAALSVPAFAAPLYWDQNGATAGFQTTASTGGTWTTSLFWSADITGSSAGGAYVSDVANTDAVFASGAANTSNSVALGSSLSARSLTFQNGRWAFTGTGTITLGSGGLTFAVPLGGSAGGDTTFASSIGFQLADSQIWTNNANNATNQVIVQGALSGTATNGNTQTLTLAGNSSGSGVRIQGVISDGSGGGKLGITVNQSTANGASTTNQLTGLANTFTGKVAVQNGGLAFNYLANAGVASGLGAASGADSIIDLGSGANTGGITLGGTSTGTNTASSSNRVINLAGTTGGGVIRNQASNSAVTLTLTGGVTNAGGGNKSLTLGGTNIGTNTISGVIADAADLSKTALVKNDVGQWVLTGANTYSGGTTINAGTLSVGTTGTLGANDSGNNILIAGGNLLLNADTNVGSNQTITISAAGGGIGVSYAPTAFPTIIDNSGATGGVFGINYTGTGGIGSIAGIDALFTASSSWFLGSFVGGSGTYTGSSLTAGQGGNYRLGGGGGALTIQNNILVGANNLVVGSTGGGSVTLSNANTYTGTTTIQNGTLNASSLNRVVGGSASSSLGAPITEANGTITLGSGSNVVTFNYTGTGESTDRILRFTGTTGNVTLGNSGTGAINYEAAPVFSGNGNKTLFLGNANDIHGGSIGAIINTSGTTSLTKQGLTNSTWILTGGAANTYTGNTTISGGVLQTAAISHLATSYVTVNGASTTQYGIWQTQGTLARTLSSTANAANLNWGANAGFAAKGGDLVLNFSSGASLTWGANGFLGTGVAPMVFGSSTADHQVELKNNFTFGDNVSSGFNRVIHVEKGVGGDSALLSGVISVGGGTSANNGFVKSGLGTLILSAANTYTGTTTVSEGTLLINGVQTAATGNTTASSGSTLGGAGIIGGATTIASGAFLTPGSTETGRGLLTFKNGLALNGTATLQITSADTRGLTYDAIDFASGTFTGTGALVLDFSALLSGGDSLSLFGGANFSSLITFSSVSATGVYSGLFDFDNGVYSLVQGAQTIYLTASSGDLSVVGSSIPEPASWAFLAGAAALAGTATRRRRRDA